MLYKDKFYLFLFLYGGGGEKLMGYMTMNFTEMKLPSQAEKNLIY